MIDTHTLYNRNKLLYSGSEDFCNLSLGGELGEGSLIWNMATTWCIAVEMVCVSERLPSSSTENRVAEFVDKDWNFSFEFEM